MRKALFGAVLLSLLLPLPLLALDGAALETLAQASVMIQPMRGTNPAKLSSIPASGSGTLVDNTIGLIVTNYHVVQDGLKPARYSKIYVSINLSDPPIECFIFETVLYSKDKDVAVLRYVSTLEDAPKKLSDIPPIELVHWGKVGTMYLNDEISIIGYPAYSEDVTGTRVTTLTITNGKVAGFIKDEEDAPDFDRAWIKTDALASWGNSGGTAIDKEGRFVGIPTQIMPDPKGARLGLLRPVDMVRPFVEAIIARPDMPALTTEAASIKGLPAAGPAAPADPSSPAGPAEGGEVGPPTVASIAFGSALTSSKKLKDPGTSFEAAKVKTLYASVAYSGFAKGDEFREAWYREGKVVFENKFAWKLGAKGDYITSLSHNGKSMPAGKYELVVEHKGVELKRAQFSLKETGAAELNVSGKVLDGTTRKAIAGATIIVLKKGVKVADYLAKKDEALVLAQAESDGAGKFALGVPLEAGVSYAVIASAPGYVQISDDKGFAIGAKETGTKDFTVTLAKVK